MRIAGGSKDVYKRQLINIAHPKFRDELWDQALACGIIGKR